MSKKIIVPVLLSASLLATPSVAFASLPSEGEPLIPTLVFDAIEELSNEDDFSAKNFSEEENQVELPVNEDLVLDKVIEELGNSVKQFSEEESKAELPVEEASEENTEVSMPEQETIYTELPVEETSESSAKVRDVCPFPCNLI